MIKGIIFDIDGVIVDSEPVHEEALKRAIRTESANTVSVNASELIGLTLEDTVKQLGFTSEQITRISKKAEEIYVSLIQPGHVRHQIKPLLQRLEHSDLTFGFVSSASKQVCLKNISFAYKGKLNLVSADNVSYSKPNPEPYLKMLSIMGLKAKEVIVIEDSDIGISSAVKANITEIYAWPHALSGSQKYANAKAIISNLSDIHIIGKTLKEFSHV